MKKIVYSLAAMASLAVVSADAKSFLSFGYGSLSGDAVDSDTVYVESGIRFGEDIKQRVGFRYSYMIDSDYSKSGTLGGVIDMYYKIGYEVYKNVVMSATLGYAFEDVASRGDDTVLATGLVYGADVAYNINKTFDIGLEYRKYDLSYDLLGEHDYEYDAISAYIGLRF